MSDERFSQTLVLNYLGMRIQASLSDMVRHLGMPTSTIVGILSRLRRKGLAAKGGTMPSGRGRPTVMYKLRLPKSVFACQFDGTQLLGGILNTDLSFQAVDIRDLGQTNSLEQAQALLKNLLSRLEKKAGVGRKEMAGLALSINAVRVGDRILRSSVLPWVDETSADSLSKGLGIPVRLVPLSSVLAEYQKFPMQAPRSLVLFRVGDGISAHSILGGRLFRGHSSLAGELGHVTVDPTGPLCGCGRRGCLEAYCSVPAIYRSMVEELAGGAVSRLDADLLKSGSARQAVDRIWQAWEIGDSYVRAFLEPVFDRLGWGLGLVMNLMDPEYVAMGGYFLQGRPAWVEEIVRRSQRWFIHAAMRKTRFAPSQIVPEDELRVIGAGFFFGADSARQKENDRELSPT